MVFEEMLGATADGRVFPLLPLSSACTGDEAERTDLQIVSELDGLRVAGLRGAVTLYTYNGNEIARGIIDDYGFLPLRLPHGTYILYSVERQRGSVFTR